jgi:hypothetical protein
VSYTSLRVDAYGFSLDPSTLYAGFTRWATGDYAFTPDILTPNTDAWRTIGTVPAPGLVSSGRVVETTLAVPNAHYLGDDYDVAQVRLVATYKVLA